MGIQQVTYVLPLVTARAVIQPFLPSCSWLMLSNLPSRREEVGCLGRKYSLFFLSQEF